MSELRDTLLHELADIFDAEQQLLKALPRMAGHAASPELKEAFENHLEETETHVERLKEVFKELGKPAKGRRCHAMQGLISEAEELMKEDQGDAALIAAAQKVEHYEIASYGSLRSWAGLLEEDRATDLLEEILDEEKTTDEKLTEIAESTINVEAAEEEAEEQEEKTERPARRRQG